MKQWKSSVGVSTCTRLLSQSATNTKPSGAKYTCRGSWNCSRRRSPQLSPRRHIRRVDDAALNASQAAAEEASDTRTIHATQRARHALATAQHAHAAQRVAQHSTDRISLQPRAIRSRRHCVMKPTASTTSAARLDALQRSHTSPLPPTVDNPQRKHRRHAASDRRPCQYSCDRPQRPTDSHCTTSTRVQRLQRLHAALTSLHTQLVSCAVE
jgi:hypothetical protein